MAPSQAAPDAALPHYGYFAYALVLCVSLAAIAWGALVVPIFWSQSTIERVATRIIRGEDYKPDVLAQLLQKVAAVQHAGRCGPTAMRAAAIVRLRVTEDAIANGERASIDPSLDALGNVVRDALVCSPADSFLWLVLYWLETTRNGFNPKFVGYLRMSYQLGPNEGWIAIKRNKLAFATFEQLSPELQRKVIKEFASLLKDQLYFQAADIFTGPAWRIRDAVLPQIASLGEKQRQQFARILYSRGYDVGIPGIARPEPRPWR